MSVKRPRCAGIDIKSPIDHFAGGINHRAVRSRRPADERPAVADKSHRRERNVLASRIHPLRHRPLAAVRVEADDVGVDSISRQDRLRQWRPFGITGLLPFHYKTVTAHSLLKAHREGMETCGQFNRATANDIPSRAANAEAVDEDRLIVVGQTGKGISSRRVNPDRTGQECSDVFLILVGVFAMKAVRLGVYLEAEVSQTPVLGYLHVRGANARDSRIKRLPISKRVRLNRGCVSRKIIGQRRLRCTPG